MRRLILIAPIFLAFGGCDNLIPNASKFLPYLNSGENPVVKYSSPISNTAGVSPAASVEIVFDKFMKIETCAQSFTIVPTTAGFLQTTPVSLNFTPSQNFSDGTYTIQITKGCEDEKGHDLKEVFTLRFAVGSVPGGVTTAPTISSVSTQHGTLAACNSGTGTGIDILTNDITDGCLGTSSARNPIVITFSEPMNTTKTSLAVSVLPSSISGDFDWSGGGTVLTITPDAPLVFGQRVTVNISTNAESALGYKMSTASSSSFIPGGILSAPVVQAIGLGSQGCSSTYPGVGSASGGDWTLGSCFWDDSLALLTTGSYRFRSGDDGTGLSGSSNACADASTDNVRIIFSNYMVITTTANAVRLVRVSPPLTSIKMATSVWSDCQSTFPFGCRVITVSFAEQEASCNGSLFGDASTGGDFNLLRTNNAPANFPYYQVFVDTTAEDVNGTNLKTQFQFTMEGK